MAAKNQATVTYENNSGPICLAPGTLLRQVDGYWLVVGQEGPPGPSGASGSPGAPGVAGRDGKDAPMSVVWQDGLGRTNPLLPPGKKPAIIQSQPVLLPNVDTIPVAAAQSPAKSYSVTNPNGYSLDSKGTPVYPVVVQNPAVKRNGYRQNVPFFGGRKIGYY